jgi:hypothetical protein
MCPEIDFSINKKIDVVIPLGIKAGWNDNEIRYCLRSLEKNFLDLREVYIVGYLPNFIQNVIHIPAEDTFKANKDANLIQKVLLACKREQLTQNFVRMSDDQLLLQPCVASDFSPMYIRDLSEINWAFMNRWRTRLKRTFEVLILQGKPIYHYDSHLPALYNKKDFEWVMNQYEWGVERAGFTINTLYFNNVAEKRKKVPEGFKANFEQPFNNIEDIKLELLNKKVAGYNDKGLTEDLKSVISSLFPEKSHFEK